MEWWRETKIEVTGRDEACDFRWELALGRGEVVSEDGVRSKVDPKRLSCAPYIVLK